MSDPESTVEYEEDPTPVSTVLMDAARPATSMAVSHPIGKIETVLSDDIRLEDFEALRRSFDKEQGKKRRVVHAPSDCVTAPKDKAQRDASDVDGFRGPWAGADEQPVAAGPSDAEMHAHLAAKELAISKAPSQPIIRPGEEKSIFHGASERDYLGRTYISVPGDLDRRLDREPGSFECFAPKRLVHTWIGHTRGVTAIRFFPGSGHLLLSASQDMRVKLWDVHRDRQCLRTFLGHNKPVRDINFDPAGHRFVSAGYDKAIRYWDTETGKCVLGLEHSAIPFCAKFSPTEPHMLLAGGSDKRIVQWDLRSGEVVQEYSQHLEAVNSITFFDDGKRFVSTADDKTIRVWDYGVPVTVRHIAEPDMHSMPAAALHPSGQHIVFQSLDNRVVTYACGQDKFQQRGRRFGGHSTAGYACNVGFSPDGKYLISGDGRGQLVCWDWKNGQVVRRIEGAHTKVCIDVQWNPQEPSRVATCSWDGTIKYWD
jgi:pre-mRNA-processing factor 17